MRNDSFKCVPDIAKELKMGVARPSAFAMSLILACVVPSCSTMHVRINSRWLIDSRVFATTDHEAANSSFPSTTETTSKLHSQHYQPSYRNPSIWGPPTWFFLHSMTLALPDKVPAEQQVAIKSFMNSLAKLLPCYLCRVHLAESMSALPIDMYLDSQQTMVQWMIDIHNNVNNLKHKRQWTNEEVLNKYVIAFSSGQDHHIWGMDAAVSLKPSYKDPSVWGPHLWFYLHSMTLALPEKIPAEHSLSIKRLMQALPKILPCGPCGRHLSDHMEEIPIYDRLFLRDSMVRWMIDIHNRVNKQLGDDGSRHQWTKEEVLEKYGAVYSGSSDMDHKMIHLFAVHRSSSNHLTVRNSLICVVFALSMLLGSHPRL